MGRRAGLAAEEGAPPSAPSRPATSPAPRTHLRGSHKGAGLRRTVAQTKARPNQLPSSSSQLQGSKLPSCLAGSQTALLSARAMKETRHPKWRVPQTTRVRTQTGFITPYKYIHSCFFSNPQHFTRMRTHRFTSTHLCRWPQHQHSLQTKVSPPHSSHRPTRTGHIYTHGQPRPGHMCPHYHVHRQEGHKELHGCPLPPALCRWTPEDLAAGLPGTNSALNAAHRGDSF